MYFFMLVTWHADPKPFLKRFTCSICSYPNVYLVCALVLICILVCALVVICILVCALVVICILVSAVVYICILVCALVVICGLQQGVQNPIRDNTNIIV